MTFRAAKRCLGLQATSAWLLGFLEKIMYGGEATEVKLLNLLVLHGVGCEHLGLDSGSEEELHVCSPCTLCQQPSRGKRHTVRTDISRQAGQECVHKEDGWPGLLLRQH